MDRLGVRVLSSWSREGGGTFHVCSGSVVDFEGDAIVNAANQGCLGGGGVDGAISDAGGPALRRLRRALPVVQGSSNVRCPTGSSVITRSGRDESGPTERCLLNCAWVIHAVGPNYRVREALGGFQESDVDQLLSSAYSSSMILAQQHAIHSVAFSLLSAAIFRGNRPLLAVLRIAVESCWANLDDDQMEVFLVAFTDRECQVLQQAAALVLGAASSPE